MVGADGVARGVWRATLFAEDDARDDDASVEDAFRALVARKERPWVVVLARGGHFAASAFDAREIGEEGRRAGERGEETRDGESVRRASESGREAGEQGRGEEYKERGELDATGERAGAGGGHARGVRFDED